MLGLFLHVQIIIDELSLPHRKGLTMCGICGYYSFGTLPDKSTIELMFQLTQSRGKDASGIAYVRDDSLKILKHDIPASELIRTSSWGDLMLPNVMIMHCRKTTQGTEKNNKNNHPIFNKAGTALIHNGIIRNDHVIFDQRDYQRDALVDSEVLLRILEGNDPWKDRLIDLGENVSGNYAIAMVNELKPFELTLIRRTSPIWLAVDRVKSILYFASTKDILTTALSQYHRGFRIGTNALEFHTMPDDTAYIIGKDRLNKIFKLPDRDFSKSWGSGYYYNNMYISNGTNYNYDAKNIHHNSYWCTVCKKRIYKSQVLMGHCPDCWEILDRMSTSVTV